MSEKTLPTSSEVAENTRLEMHHAIVSSSASRCAPNTKIAYNPNLIEILVSDHTALDDIYTKASMSAYAGLNQQSKALFAKFKDLFVDNVLRQNISLYIYLRHATRASKNGSAITRIKSEMDTIVRDVLQFLEHCIHDGAEFDDHFFAEMENIEAKLKKRSYAEQALIFPVYKRLGAVDKPIL